jgi:hypothetical protein
LVQREIEFRLGGAMTAFGDKLIETVKGEWAYFGYSTRSLGDVWHVVGEESLPPYTQHINEYWRVVGEKTWNGATPEPWSAAFISWCFWEAGAKERFPYNAMHSEYVDAIRGGKYPGLSLHDPAATAVVPGDVIWNARGKGAPRNYAQAVARLDGGDHFISHADIVIGVDATAQTCDSIGGNVSNRDPGGSVTRSTWRLNAAAELVDGRKTWIGVIKNAL